MFASTVRQGKSSSFCNIYPKEFSFPGGFPCTRMLPAVGESSPAASESTVVLPQPEGPITATNSPSYTQKLMPRAAGVSPVRVW